MQPHQSKSTDQQNINESRVWCESMMSQTTMVHVVKRQNLRQTRSLKEPTTENNEKSIFMKVSFRPGEIWRRNLQCGIAKSNFVKEEDENEPPLHFIEIPLIPWLTWKFSWNFPRNLPSRINFPLFHQNFLTFLQIYLIIFHFFSQINITLQVEIFLCWSRLSVLPDSHHTEVNFLYWKFLSFFKF